MPVLLHVGLGTFRPVKEDDVADHHMHSEYYEVTQEQADAIFNSALVYEPAVLKKHIFPLLMNVRPDSPYYEEVHSIVKFLNYFLEANVEDEIPPTSVLREFIGGNTFYR